MFGYIGSLLHVDLTRGDAERMPLSKDVLARYIGGAGLGAQLMLQWAEYDFDSVGERAGDGAALPWDSPLSPAAPIAFVFSPLVGSPLTTSAKFAVVCQSPLTERFSDSLASSAFALAGKRACGDALVITGAAATPSLLVVDHDDIQIVEAAEIWGLDIPDTEQVLREKYPGFQSAVIGPAGETCIRYATISHDGRHAGRGGSGAVFGSKNLKAIVVRGEQRCEWAKPQELADYAKELSKRSWGPATAKYRELGTAANLLAFNRMKTLPTRNFQRGSFEDAEQIAPEQLREARDHARQSCAACTIGCEHIYSLGSKEPKNVRIEYESLFSLGSLCEIGDQQAVLSAIAECDALGVDTISFGATLGFGMECVERGWVDASWLRFGNAEALQRGLEELRSQTELGRRIGAGSRSWSRELGPDAERIAPHVKGLEIPGYAPQAMQMMALGFAVGARGADHNRSGAYEVDFSNQVDRKAATASQVHLAVDTENRAALMDSLILCKFIRGALTDFYEEVGEMLRLTTGRELTRADLVETANRIVAAKHTFNQLAGWTKAEDTLPPRMLEQPLDDDPQAAITEETLRELVQAYYELRGWSHDGKVAQAPRL